MGNSPSVINNNNHYGNSNNDKSMIWAQDAITRRISSFNKILSINDNTTNNCSILDLYDSALQLAAVGDRNIVKDYYNQLDTNKHSNSAKEFGSDNYDDECFISMVEEACLNRENNNDNNKNNCSTVVDCLSIYPIELLVRNLELIIKNDIDDNGMFNIGKSLMDTKNIVTVLHYAAIHVHRYRNKNKNKNKYNNNDNIVPYYSINCVVISSIMIYYAIRLQRQLAKRANVNNDAEDRITLQKMIDSRYGRHSDNFNCQNHEVEEKKADSFPPSRLLDISLRYFLEYISSSVLSVSNYSLHFVIIQLLIIMTKTTTTILNDNDYNNNYGENDFVIYRTKIDTNNIFGDASHPFLEALMMNIGQQTTVLGTKFSSISENSNNGNITLSMELIRSLLLLFARQIPTPFSAPLHNNSRKKSGETLLATSSIHLLLLLSFYRPMTGKIQLSNPFLKTIRNLRNEEEYSNINKAKNGKIVHHVSVSSNDNSKGKTMYTLFNFRTLQKTVASTLAAYCEANASNEIKINGESNGVDECILLLYLLTNNNQAFVEYIVNTPSISKKDNKLNNNSLDELLLPIFTILCKDDDDNNSDENNRRSANSERMYVLLIIILILSTNPNFVPRIFNINEKDRNKPSNKREIPLKARELLKDRIKCKDIDKNTNLGNLCIAVCCRIISTNVERCQKNNEDARINNNNHDNHNNDNKNDIDRVYLLTNCFAILNNICLRTCNSNSSLLCPLASKCLTDALEATLSECLKSQEQIKINKTNKKNDTRMKTNNTQEVGSDYIEYIEYEYTVSGEQLQIDRGNKHESKNKRTKNDDKEDEGLLIDMSSSQMLYEDFLLLFLNIFATLLQNNNVENSANEYLLREIQSRKIVLQKIQQYIHGIETEVGKDSINLIGIRENQWSMSKHEICKQMKSLLISCESFKQSKYNNIYNNKNITTSSPDLSLFQYEENENNERFFIPFVWKCINNSKVSC